MSMPELQPYTARYLVRLPRPAAPEEQRRLLTEWLERTGQACIEAGAALVGHLKALATQPGGGYLAGSLTSVQGPAQVDGNLQEGDQLDVQLAVLVYGLEANRLARIAGQTWQELAHAGLISAAIQQDNSEKAEHGKASQALQMHFAPEIDLGWFWRFEGVERGGRQPSQAARRTAASLLPEALSLAYPAAHMRYFRVREVQKKRVLLENEAVLNGGLVGHLLAGAKEIAVGVATIGGKLEERSRRYFEEGHPARGYLLDGLGTVALGSLAECVRREIETAAKRRGLAASTPISPGHADWKLAEQVVLFDLLPGNESGVVLNRNYLMAPRKSISMVIGLGDTMITHADSTQCEYCSLQKTCTYRRLPGEEWHPGRSLHEEVTME